MPRWLIPLFYTVGSVLAGTILPRLENAYLSSYTHDVSVSSALAFFSAVGSGMMALTGIVFAIAFVVVQFSSVAYSPRLVIVFGSDPTLFHTLGVFFATFSYSLATIVWTDRSGSGKVPLFSSMLVEALLIVSMLAFARLIQSLNDLQVHNVLRVIGTQGRSVIQAMFPGVPDDGVASNNQPYDLGPVTQTIVHRDEPRVVARYDLAMLGRLAQMANAVVVLECGVGDTLVEDTVLLRVHGGTQPLPEAALMRAIRLSTVRTFEQDPKYAIRLLVDIAIRALSPAVNDPTTAVQALDQIEDLLRRLGRRQLDAGEVRDASGALRVIFPVPTWEDYLALSFDEIRQFGATSVQVVRRLRAALVGLADTVVMESRRDAVRQYLAHLNLGIEHSSFDVQDQAAALQEDRQGLGLSRKRRPVQPVPKATEAAPRQKATA